jgi:hypothetical protein
MNYNRSSCRRGCGYAFNKAAQLKKRHNITERSDFPDKILCNKGIFKPESSSKEFPATTSNKIRKKFLFIHMRNGIQGILLRSAKLHSGYDMNYFYLAHKDQKSWMLLAGILKVARENPSR